MIVDKERLAGSVHTYSVPNCMDCIKGVTRETSTKPPCKKEYKCGTTCPVCFKLCLSFINIIKMSTNHNTNVPNTWLIANKLGHLTCINGRRFQSCNSNNSQFSLFTGSTQKMHYEAKEYASHPRTHRTQKMWRESLRSCHSVVVSFFNDQRVIIINGDKQLLSTEVRESIENMQQKKES